MSLGESMLSTLKSNRSIMLNKSKHFKKTIGGYTKKPRIQYNLPDASPELLIEIKEKIIRQNKKTRTLNLIIGFVLVVIAIALYALI